jgi:hypothetical protein
MVLPAHVLQAMQVRMKSINQEGHFTLEAERLSRPYIPQDFSEVTEKYHMVLPAYALQELRVRLKSVSNEGYFILEVETVIRPMSPRIAVGSTGTSCAYATSSAI